MKLNGKEIKAAIIFGNTYEREKVYVEYVECINQIEEEIWEEHFSMVFLTEKLDELKLSKDNKKHISSIKVEDGMAADEIGYDDMYVIVDNEIIAGIIQVDSHMHAKNLLTPEQNEKLIKKFGFNQTYDYEEIINQNFEFSDREEDSEEPVPVAVSSVMTASDLFNKLK